jgi:hypothetical protein
MSSTEQAFYSYLRTAEADKLKKEQEELEEISPSLEELYNTSAIQPMPQVGETPLTIQQKQQQRLPIGIEDVLYSPVEDVFEHPKFRTGKKYSLADLEKDPEFQMRSERFMESIGENDDIFEYLRDPNYSVTQAFQRSIDIGQWTDESKEDYLWLQEIFDNAELGGFKQAMGLAKDLTIDLVTDPFNLLALVFAGPSLGASTAVKASLTKATTQALKKASKASVKRLARVAKGKSAEAAKQTAKYGMTEGAAFTGPHDYFLQDAEKELGLRENIDLTQTALSAGIGTVLGGIFGGGLGFMTAYSPMLKFKIYNYANEGAIISESKGTTRALEKEKWEEDNLLHVDNEDSLVHLYSGLPVPPDMKILESSWWKQQAKKKTPIRKKKVGKKGKEPDPSTAHPNWVQKALLGYFGKSVSELALGAENSLKLQDFLGKLRYDWNHTLTKGVQKLEAYTFDENTTRSQGLWMTIKEEALLPLFRATWKDGDNFKGKVANLFNDNLDYDQNAQLVRLIWEPEATEIVYKAANGVDNIRISRANIHPDVEEAAKGIKKLTDEIFGEALKVGLVTREQLMESYFPRQFQYDKIIANKPKFIRILENSNHSAPINEFSKSAYVINRRFLTDKGKLRKDTIRALEKRDIKSSRDGGKWTTVNENDITLNELKKLERLRIAAVGREAKWVDQELFGTDFYHQAMLMNKKAGGLEWTEKKINDVYDKNLGKFIKGKISDEQEKIVFNKAKRLKAEALTENILAKREAGYFDTAYLDAINFKTSIMPGAFKSRVFTEIPDATIYDESGKIVMEGFEDFLDTNVNRVYTDYIIGSARAIERTKLFGKSESVFQNKFLDPIRAELTESGVSFEDRQHILGKVKTLYKRTTGLENPTWETIIKGDLRSGKAIRSITDWAKISQQLAHLPLATLSSITEPLILLSRINNPNIISKEGGAAFKDMGHALVKGIKKDLDRWGRVRAKMTGKKVRGLKDIGDEEWQELYKVGMALEQATMDRLQGLYGEAPKGAFARGVQNAFFHANLLTQWTGAVQLAAFTTGKRLIRENAEKLYNHKARIVKLSPKDFERTRNRLWEAGISEERAIKWYRGSLDKNKQFDESLAQGLSGSKKLKKAQLGFYHNYYQRGAARFAKEIILTPTTSAANRPLWHSHPAGQLLAQFAGYPTAFNNTILKRFAQELYTDPLHASPKIVATTTLMTSIAVLGNAIRSQGDSLAGDPGDIIAKGIQRWGGMGPLEVAYRYKINAGYGSGQMGSLLKAPSGPLAQDVVDMILYRKGLGEMTVANLPGSAAFQMVGGDAYKDWLLKKGKNLDKATWGRVFGKPTKIKPPTRRKYYGYAIGGEVNIPNAKTEPDEKIDRMTGLPYNLQAGVLGQDEEERFGFAEGGTPTIRNDDEVLSFLTRDIQKAAPYLDTGEALEIYSEEETKGFAKGITQTVYRTLEEGLDIESLEQFDLTDEIGVHVDTKKQAGKQAGKVRLYNSLDLRQRQVENFKGSEFIQTLIDREEVKNTIIKHSKLNKKEAEERIKDLIADYQYTIKAVKAEEPVDVERVNYAMNVKLSQETKSILNELGYDSILYDNEGSTSAILFEQGQFIAIREERREGFAGGGVISKLLANLLSKRNTKLLAKYENHPEVKGITDAIDKLQKDIGTTVEKNPKIREFLEVDDELSVVINMRDETPSNVGIYNKEAQIYIENLDKRWAELLEQIDMDELNKMSAMKNQVHQEAEDMDGLLTILDDKTISSVDEREIAFDKWKTHREKRIEIAKLQTVQKLKEEYEGPTNWQKAYLEKHGMPDVLEYGLYDPEKSTLVTVGEESPLYPWEKKRTIHSGGGRIGFAEGKIISLLARQSSKLSTKHREKLRQIKERERQLEYEKELENAITSRKEQVKKGIGEYDEEIYTPTDALVNERVASLNPFEKKVRLNLQFEYENLLYEFHKEGKRIKKLAEKKGKVLPNDYLGNKAGYTSSKYEEIIDKMKKVERIRKKRFNEDWEGITPEEHDILWGEEVVMPDTSYATIFDPRNSNSPHYVPVVFKAD